MLAAALPRSTLARALPVPAMALLPVRVRVPEPDLVNPPVPLITPLKVLLVLSAPAVSVLESSVTLPAPAIEPTASLATRLNTAPLATVTALVLAIALPPLTVSVPALIVYLAVANAGARAARFDFGEINARRVRPTRGAFSGGRRESPFGLCVSSPPRCEAGSDPRGSALGGRKSAR